MTRPIVKEHNVTTGEIIEREMNDLEFTQHQASQAELEAAKADLVTKEAARQAVLTKLGLTAEEATALLA